MSNNGTTPLSAAKPTFNKSLLSSVDSVYQRNFLIWNGTIYPHTENEKTGDFLVMDIKDIKKWFLDFSNAGFSQSTVETAVNSPLPVPDTYSFPGYTGDVFTYTGNSYVHASFNTVNDTDNIDKNLFVINAFDFNNQLAIGELNPSTHGSSTLGMEDIAYAGMRDEHLNRYGGYLNPGEPQKSYQGVTGSWGAVGDYRNAPEFPGCPRDDLMNCSFTSYVPLSNDDMLFMMSGNWGQQNGICSMYDEQTCITTKEKSILKWMSWAGVLFKYNNIMYKPIIEQGVVIGYSSDMSKPSEWDNMTNVTGNNIPLTPPVPLKHVDDIETDMPLAYIGGTAGMVDFIRINAAGLASADDISDALSKFDITAIGKDLLRNFVAFKCFCVINIDDSVVRDIKVSGHTLKDENDNALQGEYIGSVAPVDFDAGTIEPLYGDFRDYAPYTRLQMYVPFCGWFDLPPWCMGKHIHGTMFTDLYNGTVKAVIYASNTVVAEAGGCCSFDIPFAAESTGMKAGAVISSALSTIAMTGATIAAPNIATGIAAVTSAANLVSAANANGTTLKGVLGDGSNVNGLLHIYIKTTRPMPPTDITSIPDQYKHEYGVPCYKQIKLSSGQGYTQILNPSINGAMTDREKQMIIDGFKHGLIL